MSPRRLLIASLIAAGLTIVLGPTVFADDCAAPGDCSNTAWAVGGAGVAVAIAVAAATSKWLPDHPEEGLSPECYAALDALLQKIHATMNQIGELVVARQGAKIEHDAVEIIRQRTLDTAGTMGDALGIIADAASKAGTGADTLGTSASITQTMLKARNAAINRQLSAVTNAIRASGADAAELGAITFAARAANAGRTVGVDKLTTFGKGLGVLSLLSAAASTAASLSRERQLNLYAQLTTLADLKRGEAWRWQRMIDDLTDRIYALDPMLTAQVAAYNAKAQECHAHPLERPTMNSMIGDMEAAAPMGDSSSGAEAPPSVLPGPPPPVPDRDPPQGCDRAVYDQEVADYNQALSQWKEARGYLSLWRRHCADLEASIAPVEADWQRLQAVLADAKMRGYGATGVSAAATTATLVLSLTPMTCVVLGIISVTADLYGSSAGPTDAGTLQPALFKNQLDWLKSRRGYFNGELERRRNIFEVSTDNVLKTWRTATGHATQCAWSVSPPWPSPNEDPPDITEQYEHGWPPVVPQARRYQEIGTWL